MSARSNKERKRKQQMKRSRERRRQALGRHGGEMEKSGGGQHVPAPHLPPFPPRKASPPPRPKSPIELWWEQYSAGDGEHRLRMAREKLESVYPGDDWYEEVFPEAVYELQTKLSSEAYVAFLEAVREQRPDVFALSADWNVREMAFLYISQGRYAELEAAVGDLARGLESIDRPVFSLMSLLRLADQETAAGFLVDAIGRPVATEGLMAWAVNELIEWAMFPVVQRCVAAGVSDEAFEESYRVLLDLGAEDSKRNRRDHRDFVLHLASRAAGQWSRDDFKNEKEAGRKVFLLLADFSRWLWQSRNFPPIAADEFRRLLVHCVDGMECPVNAFLRGVKRSEFEPFLAGKLRFLSLDHFHAPATVIGMLHFYDFLAERGLVDQGVCDATVRVCRELWKGLTRAMKNDWDRFKFLERYLPSP